MEDNSNILSCDCKFIRVVLHFQTLRLSQHSINSTNATWFWQLQPFLYTEKPSHCGSKAGECSA